MQKNNFFIFAVILFTIILCSCEKDKVTINGNCFEIGDMESISYYIQQGAQFKFPTYNPKNKNEIIFNYCDQTNNEINLVKYDIITGVKTILAQNVLLASKPSWGINGWIAFDNILQNHQIFIIKENGDSLKQFTTESSNLFPIWDANGENLYWQHSETLSHPYFFLKKGLNSSITDTVFRNSDSNFGLASYNTISNENILLTNTLINNEIHLAFSSLNSINMTSVFNVWNKFNTDYIRGLTWSNNNELAYFSVFNGKNNSGLFKVEVKSGKLTKLLDFCYGKKYTEITCSPDGTKLICERIDSYLEKNSNNESTGAIIEKSHLYIIDLITLQETKIDVF